MSAYDFNEATPAQVFSPNESTLTPNHNQTPSRHQFNNSVANDVSRNQYQVSDGDFLSARASCPDNSSTGPTSKTALLVRQRREMFEPLSCFICKGYLIDATTIKDCMDSFCKSCIVTYLSTSNYCPKCGVIISETHPLSAIHSDKVLQDIVYKLVPGLYDNEMKQRRQFYREMYALSGSSDDDGSSDMSLWKSEQYGAVTHPKPFYKPSDEIHLSIEPQTRADTQAIYYDNKRQSIVTCFTGSIQQQQNRPPSGTRFSLVDSRQFKTYLECPAKLTGFQLKKFIAAKFNICREDTIHLLYLNETIKDEYSLIDVAYIYDWRGVEHMRMYYIIERDLSKSTDLYDLTPEGRKRQSVGTSTQTTKRVCIDPQPKFYEEPNDNPTATSGRAMRSTRMDNYASNSKSIAAAAAAAANRTSKAPILRSVTAEKTAHQTNGLPAKRAAHSHEMSNGQAKAITPQMTGSNGSVAIPKINISLKNPNHVATRSSATTIAAGPSQGSVVTVASFTESRNNQVVTVSAKTATFSEVFRGGSESNRPSEIQKTSPVVSRMSEQPKTAFSYITEKGITIRLHNQESLKQQATTSRSPIAHQPTTDNRNKQMSSPAVLIRPDDSRSASSTTPAQQTSSTRTTPTSLSNINQSSSLSLSSAASGSSRMMPDGTSARHHVKVKPVYKTFVDPTKLKSANIKRLGFTARH